jgi:hypothetical protein
LHKGIGTKHINVADMRAALFPLPPFAEQHRIVAKVDEPLAICRRLDGRFTDMQTESRRLLEAVLDEALRASHQGPSVTAKSGSVQLGDSRHTRADVAPDGAPVMPRCRRRMRAWNRREDAAPSLADRETSRKLTTCCDRRRMPG